MYCTGADSDKTAEIIAKSVNNFKSFQDRYDLVKTQTGAEYYCAVGYAQADFDINKMLI